MTSAQEIRDRLEGYARAKIASVMQPLTEQLLVDQPGDPIEYMVRYLVQNRSDLRKHVVSETLAVREEGGRRSIPVVDHPLMDRVEELEHALKLENKFRRKEKKAAAQQITRLSERIKDLEGRLVAAGLPLDPSIDKEMRSFLAWDAKAAAASPEDPRDTGEFKFRFFETLPPMTSKHKSLMKNLLKDEKFAQLQKLQTSFGTTISHFIQAGVTQPKIPYGIACGDSECPSVFNDLYLPIVRAVHGLDPLTEKFETQMSAVGMALGGERERVFEEHVSAVRIKAVRNVSGLPFPSRCLHTDREEVETLLVAAFNSLDGEVAGTYERLEDMDPDDEEQLQHDDLLLDVPEATSLAAASGAARDWPANRGVFSDPERSVVCWCNGPDDHVTLQVLQRDHDIVCAFRKMCALHHGIQNYLEANAQRRWVLSEDFGFVGACPSNVGISLVCTVVLRLPTAGKDSNLMLSAVNHLHLKLEKIKVPKEEGAEKPKIGEPEEWLLTHKRVFGVTEERVIQKMMQGISELCAAAAQLPALPSR